MLVVKHPPANAGNIRDVTLMPGWEDPLEDGLEIRSSILLGESSGQRSLVNYGPGDCKELERTVHLSTNHLESPDLSIQCITNMVQ